MRQRERAQLIRELDALKTRMRTHAIDVAYGGGRRKVRTLSEHIADIKRRDVIERLLTEE